jgi:hypothetical protein
LEYQEILSYQFLEATARDHSLFNEEKGRVMHYAGTVKQAIANSGAGAYDVCNA